MEGVIVVIVFAAICAVVSVINWLLFAFVFMMPNPGWSGIEPFILAPFVMIFGGVIGALSVVALNVFDTLNQHH